MSPKTPRGLNPLLWLSLSLYSLLIYTVVVPLLKIAALFNESLASQIQARRTKKFDPHSLKAKRAQANRCIVYFCSSAGEYEQAKPIMDRLGKDPKTFQHVFFFSASGIRYAEKRGETVSFSFAPLDTLWTWSNYLNILRPDLTIVIRHELWPAFLAVSRRFGQVCVVDAGRWGKEKISPLKLWAKRWLFALVDKVFTISKDDLEFYRVNIKENEIYTIGDTKYDRVMERSQEKAAEVIALKEFFTPVLRLDASLLVGGSVWKPDIKLLLDSYEELKRSKKFTQPRQLLLAPHDLSVTMISWIESQCQVRGISAIKFSSLRKGEAAPPSDTYPKFEVLIIDTLGILTEVYGLGHLAFVGGAMDHKVHNVLEPMAYGLPVAFGPHFKNSQEALLLVEKRLATPVENSVQFKSWWLSHSPEQNSQHSAQIKATMQDLCGASDHFLRLSHYGG